MSSSLTFSITDVGPTIANRSLNGVVAVLNDGGADVTLSMLRISEVTQSGSKITQPTFLVPNVAPGTNPTITAGTTSYFPFQVVFNNPNTPGASPNTPNAFMGVDAVPVANPIVQLRCTGQTGDGVFSNDLFVPVLSAVAPFPVPAGGTLQFNKTGSNFMSLAILGAL